MHLLINLVDDQDQLPSSRAEHRGQFPIQRSQSGATINDKKQKIRACDGHLCRRVSRLCKVGVRRITDATGIDDLKRNGPLLADTGKPIPRHSRLIMDNGHPLPHEAVEEGGFAHIGATDYGDASH